GRLRMGAEAYQQTVSGRIHGDLQHAVQRGAFRMSDVLIASLTDEDWQRIRGYKQGLSAAEMRDGLIHGADTVYGWARDAGRVVWSISTQDVPTWFNQDFLPFLERNGITRENAKGFLEQAKE